MDSVPTLRSTPAGVEETLECALARQAERHKRYDYLEELRSLLKAHQVAFDDRYLVDDDVSDVHYRADDVAAEASDGERVA